MICNVVGLQSAIYGVRERKEIFSNLNHLNELIDNMIFSTTLETPPRLVVLSEGALQGFYDEITDMDHIEYCKKIAIEVPGKETDVLAKKTKEHNLYIIGTAKALWPEVIKNRFFNTSFIIDPNGNIIHKAAKTVVGVMEGSCTPHNIWDVWVEQFGEGTDAFYPVTETEIGRIGRIICKERCFPEVARALGINGAEIITMPSYPEPLVSRDWLEIQTRARAIDNTCYAIAPNIGPYFNTVDSKIPWALGGGQSLIVDYKGAILSHLSYVSEGYVAAPINVDELREYRMKCGLGGGIAYMPCEQWKAIYEKEFWPKNIFLRTPPPNRKGRLEILKKVTEKVIKGNIYKKPR
jgi:predicted amidohydrolase